MCCCSPLYLYSVTKKSCTMCHDKNQAGARRGARLQCHRGTRRWNLSYPKTLSQLCGPYGSFYVFSFAFLEFKSNDSPTIMLCDRRADKLAAAKQWQSKRIAGKKHNRPVRGEDPLPARRADSEQKPFVDLVLMA